MRLLIALSLLLLSGCGAETPPAEPAPAPPSAAPTSAAGSVPADHVLQPQLQALDNARGVQELTDASKARVDEAVDERQP